MPPLDRVAVGIALAAIPLRILIAASTTLTPDEAYYASAALLGTTVPDHPPLVVFGALLGQVLPPAVPLVLRLRLVPLILGTLVSLLVIDSVRRESGTPAAQRWAAVLSSWLLLPLAGGFLATPDVGVFLATLVLLETERRTHDSWTGSVVASAAAALGMASKVVMAPIALAVVATSRHGWRHRFVVLCGFLASLPLARESLAFQLNHALMPGDLAALRVGPVAALGAALVAQVALWTPIVIALSARAARRLPRSHLAVAATLTGLFLLSALVRGVPPEPNWLAPAFAAVLPMVAHQLADASLLVRSAFVVSGPAMTLVAVSHVLMPWLPLPADRDPTARLHGVAEPSAVGVGPYGPASLRCCLDGDCGDILLHIQRVRSRLTSAP